jgi:hypothetical protein
MLMIGVQGQCPDEAATGKDGPWADGFVQPTVTEQRTHFGLWCTLSAPLTLSMDFQNKTATDSVWHIVSNTHAIAVNQAWAGHPGTTFELGNSSTGTAMITLEGNEVRKRHFLSHLYIKCIILPRQARDEHRENSKKVPLSLRASPLCHSSRRGTSLCQEAALQSSLPTTATRQRR